MQLHIIGVPYNLDRPATGMGMAPQALLDAGLPRRLEALGWHPERTEMVSIPPIREPREARLGRLLARLREAIAGARTSGRFPLVLGGDCMTALGTLAGLGAPGQSGIVWFDAHGDFNNPETTLSGYLGGMPLACLVGRGLGELRAASGLPEPVPERHVVLAGVRDLDPPEERALASSAVRWMHANVLRQDPARFDRALDEVETLSRLYLHVDIDVLDPAVAPGVDFPVPDGLSLAELQETVGRVAERTRLAAVALTAVNPEKDHDGRTVAAALDTIEVIFSSMPRSWPASG